MIGMSNLNTIDASLCISDFEKCLVIYRVNYLLVH